MGRIWGSVNPRYCIAIVYKSCYAHMCTFFRERVGSFTSLSRDAWPPDMKESLPWGHPPTGICSESPLILTGALYPLLKSYLWKLFELCDLSALRMSKLWCWLYDSFFQEKVQKWAHTSLSEVEQTGIGVASFIVFYLVTESCTHEDAYKAKRSSLSFIHTDYAFRK